MEKLKIIVIVILFASCNRVTDFPVVTTGSSNSTNSSVVGVGEVVSTGGDKNVTRGFYYWKMEYPNRQNEMLVHQESGIGEYSIDLSSFLEEDEAYFYCAFAENKLGRSYGETKPLVANPKNATINSRGCIECDDYNFGEYFFLDNQRMLVADLNRLRTASLNRKDLSNLCTSKLKKLELPYGGFGGVTKWDVSNVEDMTRLFADWDTFDQNITNWDVSSVTDMTQMFAGAYHFNRDISNWDVSSVTDMDLMFIGAANFNQNLSNWCVSNISSQPYSFSSGSALTASNHPVWGTCP